MLQRLLLTFFKNSADKSLPVLMQRQELDALFLDLMPLIARPINVLPPPPFNLVFEDGVTFYDGKRGGFVLNPPAKISIDKSSSLQFNEVAVRISVSYEFAQKILEDRNLARFFFEKAYNHAKILTDDALKIYDHNNIYGYHYLSFHMPGRQTQEIFLELSESYGYEFRFYSQCGNIK